MNMNRLCKYSCVQQSIEAQRRQLRPVGNSNVSRSLSYFIQWNNSPAIFVCRHSSARSLSPVSSFFFSNQRFMSAAAPAYDHHSQEDATTASNAANNTATIPFQLADIGEGIFEVELLQWLVKEGQTVSQFDPICEVQSDKATVEITSRFDGVITSLEGDVGDMIQVGKPLLWIQVPSSSSSPSATATATATANNNDNNFDQSSHTPPPQTTPPIESNRINGGSVDCQGTNRSFLPRTIANSLPAKVLATPAVRKLAMDYQLDLSTLTGTGPNGRVLKADVLQFVNHTQPASVNINSIESEQPAATDTNSDSVYDENRITEHHDHQQTQHQPLIQPIRGYNRLMVKTMTESLTIPHMGYGDEVDVTRLLEHKRYLEASASTRLSVLALSVKALSLAMLEYPAINSSICLESMTLTLHPNHNVGIAMDTPRGLAVPVIRNCQDKSIVEITQEIDRLKSLAQEGRLAKEDLDGSTITLSNIGSIGGTYTSPIISSPQVAIGAMGKIRRTPRFVDDSSLEVEEAHIMTMTWAGDHRALDGATLARFAERWKQYLETPTQMLLSMR